MKFLNYQILSFFVITSTLTADNFSLNFDGQNDYVDLGQNLLSGTGDFSISLWANSTSSSSDQILIQKRDVNGFNGEYLLLFKSNGKIKIWTYRNGYQWTVVSPEIYNDGEWHHIVAVQDNSINGGIYPQPSSACLINNSFIIIDVLRVWGKKKLTVIPSPGPFHSP